MFHFIVNPAGASGRTGRIFRKLEEEIRQTGKEYQVHYSSPVFGIEDICRDLTGRYENPDLVIVGGDGTMNEAVNGIRDISQVRVGYIPAGSGNDLARGLGLPADRMEILHAVLEGKVRRCMDVGQTEFLTVYDRNDRCPKAFESEVPVIRRWNVSSGIGFDAHICQKAEASKAKKILNRLYLGKLIYVGVAANIVLTEKKVPFEIRTDAGTLHLNDCLFAVGMNQPYEGGGFRFCPSAEDNDGKLSVCTADHVRQIDFFRIFPYAYSGNHLKFEGVETFDTESMEIRTAEPLWVHTDGEIACMSDHVRMSINEQQLQLLM